VASGNYAFLPPLQSSTSSAPVADGGPARIEVTGPIATPREAIEAVVPDVDPALTAETSSATIVAQEAPKQEPAPVIAAVAPAVTQTAALSGAPPSLPAAAPAAVSVYERWAAAGIILETQGQEWDEQTLANVDAALLKLPPGVRSQLGNPALGPLHILINSRGRALSGKQPYGGPANYFSTGDGVNELVMFPRQRVQTILHELGHAYNLRRTPAGHYARVLADPEMQSFLAATGWQVLATPEQIAVAVDHMRLSYQYSGSFRWPEISKFDPLEDFANSFAAFYADPEGLRAQSPERYNWMAANLPR
jgi:hypothetical protein